MVLAGFGVMHSGFGVMHGTTWNTTRTLFSFYYNCTHIVIHTCNTLFALEYLFQLYHEHIYLKPLKYLPTSLFVCTHICSLGRPPYLSPLMTKS